MRLKSTKTVNMLYNRCFSFKKLISELAKRTLWNDYWVKWLRENKVALLRADHCDWYLAFRQYLLRVKLNSCNGGQIGSASNRLPAKTNKYDQFTHTNTAIQPWHIANVNVSAVTFNGQPSRISVQNQEAHRVQRHSAELKLNKWIS